MKTYRSLILTLSIALSALVAYGVFFSMPSPKDVDAEGFSSARVVKDLEVIAQEPHSVAHPEARDRLLNYLTERLEKLGGNPQTYVYPNITSRKFTFDAKNLLAEFPPLKASSDTTYLLMMAHHDSRYPWKLMGDTVTALGAVDDGYGLGIILESIHQALKYRKEWNQGIKVLFTDAEEVDLQGMKAAHQYNKEIFDNVGLILNIEARGPFGPALLFETSPGNERLVKLYADHARYPFGYSITNMVYQQMPNGTDFNIVRDSIAGFNFSPVQDINHYHTDLDNIHNISEKTIQHYGEQIMPLMKEYLTNKEYAEKSYFLAEEDVIYFSIPLLGTFHFPKNTYWLLNIGVFFLLLHLMFKQNNLPWKTILKPSGITIALGLGWIVVGEFIAWLSALSVGARFKLFGTVQGIPFDNAIILLSVLILVVGMVRFVQNLYASLFTLMLLSFIALIIAGENMMFFIPLCIGTLSVMLWQATSSRIFPLLGVCLILLHAFSFVYIIAMALTIGALGLVLLVAFCHLIVVIPLAKLYLADKASSRMP
jgi:hypothetical protein